MAAEGKVSSRLVGVIFALVGFMLLGLARWTTMKQYAILKTWPAVDAQVTKSRVTRFQSHSRHPMPMYKAEIEFRYAVNGKEYLASSSTLGSSNERESERKIEDYAPGTMHAIRYNPGNPNDIRFDVGYTFAFFFGTIIYGGMGLLFAAVGMAAVVMGLWPAPRAAPAQVCRSCGQPVEKGLNFCPRCSAPPASG